MLLQKLFSEKYVPYINLFFIFSLSSCFLFFGEKNILVTQIWALLIILWSIFSFFSTPRSYKQIKIGVLEIILGILALYLLVLFYFNAPDSAYKHRRFYKIISYVLLFINSKQSLGVLIERKKIHWFFYWILALCFYQNIIALFQYFKLLSSNNEYFNIAGSFLSPNLLGVFLSIGQITAIWLLSFSIKKSRIRTILLLGFSVINIFILILSASRTAFLMLLVGSTILFFSHQKVKDSIRKVTKLKQILFVSILLSLLGTVFLSLYHFKKDSADGRFLIAKITLPLIKEKPAFGHGILSFIKGYNTAKSNYFTSEKRSWEEEKLGSYVYSSFNDYLYFLYETGFVGFILLLALLVVVFFNLKNKNELQVLGVAVLAAFFVGAFFLSLSRNIHFLTIGFVFLGILSFYQSEKMIILSSTLSKINFIRFPLIIIATSLIYTNYYNRLTLKNYISASTDVKKQVSPQELHTISRNVFNNGYSQFYYGYDLVQRGNIEEGLKEMELGAAQNAAPKLYTSLAKLYIKHNNHQRAAALFKINTGNESYRYEPRMNLLKLYESTHNYGKSIEMAKEIINFGVKRPSKKVDEYKAYAKKVLQKYHSLE